MRGAASVCADNAEYCTCGRVGCGRPGGGGGGGGGAVVWRRAQLRTSTLESIQLIGDGGGGVG